MRYSIKAMLAAVALSSEAAANLSINNWCSQTVSYYLSHNGSCNYGPTSTWGASGPTVCNGTPYTINAGTIGTHNWWTDGEGTSIKLTLGSNFANGVLQFEYTMATGTYGGLYWDLSDLDGSGPGLVGTPFYNYNVKVSPTGDGQGAGTCLQIKCPSGQVCLDAYQSPDEAKTRWCPVDTGTMWLDLCEPLANFNS